MKKSDVAVIGGGVAGLFAAAIAARKGKKVTVLAYGAGAMTIGGGIVDIMGYAPGNRPYATPMEGVEAADAAHPYKMIGKTAVREAVEEFCRIAKKAGYPYIGSLDKMNWIPTAAGTLKPTCLAPRSMDGEALNGASRILIVGMEGLKDFSAQMVAKNLALIFPNKTIDTLVLPQVGEEGRDMTALDAARYLDQEGVRTQIAQAIKGKVTAGTVVVTAPIIGSHANYEVYDALTAAIGCPVVETAAMPPSVTGTRLRELLLGVLRGYGVQIIEKAQVVEAITEGGKAKAVVTQSFGRKRAYYADEFILATGGFYGGGMTADQEIVKEVVFGLPVSAPADVEKWSNMKMFSNEKQTFAQIGIAVNENLQPVNKAGKAIYTNVRVVGRALAGYDFCFENSGNGVAVTSAYKAASLLGKGGKRP